MRVVAFCLVTLLFAGCQSAPVKKTETRQETVSALTSMTAGLTGQSVSEQDLRKAAVQVQNDPEARSAVTAVSGSFTDQGVDIKYCPVDGKRFSGRLTKCPEHGVDLLPLQ